MIISVNDNGLCNRIKSLMNALIIRSDSMVYWPVNERVNCPYSKLFIAPNEVKEISVNSIIENTWRLFINGKDVSFLYDELKPNDVTVIKSVLSLFKLNEDIKKIVDSNKAKYEGKDISLLSIRTWRNAVRNVKNNAIIPYRFYDKNRRFNPKLIELILGNCKETFYLTCDNDQYAKYLIDKYRNKIIYTPKRTFWGDVSDVGVIDSLVDLYIGSMFKKKFLTYKSTFCEMQYYLGGCEGETIII